MTELTNADGEGFDSLSVVIREVALGHIPIKIIGESWIDVYAGEFKFKAGGWEIHVFNDCDSWDYIDLAIAPSGKRYDFDDLAALGIYIGGEHSEQLENLFRSLPEESKS